MKRAQVAAARPTRPSSRVAPRAGADRHARPDPGRVPANNQAVLRAIRLAAKAPGGVGPPGQAPAEVAATIRQPGETLPGAVRERMERRLGGLPDDVRIHRDAAAASSARQVAARAYTVGAHVVFAEGAFAAGTAAGDDLLAHELTHVRQQRGAPFPPTLRVGRPDDGFEGEARGHDAGPTRVAEALVQRTEAADTLISANTSWGDLDEAALGRQLRVRAVAGETQFVRDVLDALSSTDRDDVAYETSHACADEELATIANAADGRRLLDRLYDEITSGSVSSEEAEEAERLLRIKANRITPEDFEAGILTAKVFPFRLPGLTVLSDAPISAQPRSGGRIWVKQPVRVLGTSEFRDETRTLPTRVFIGGIEIPENEVVGVKLYDQGGTVIYRPALYLVQLSNETTTTVMTKIGEAAAIGLTLGGGSLLAGAGEATLFARALLVADRIAFALSVATSILREHRGWIISRFGDRGRNFVTAVDRVNSVLAIYGLARTAVGAVQTVSALRSAYNEWTAARSAIALAESEAAVVDDLANSTDDLLREMDDLSNVVPLRPAGATGTGTGGTTTAAGGGPPVSGRTTASGSAFEGTGALDLRARPSVVPVREVTPAPVGEPATVLPFPTPAVEPPVTAPLAALGPTTPPTSVPLPPVFPSTASLAAPATAAQPAPQPAHGQPSSGPFPIFWPSLLPLVGLNGVPIVSIGTTTIRWNNPRGTSVTTSEQIRVRRHVIAANPATYPPGTHEAHHVMPLSFNGLDVFPNVVPWPHAQHQSQHWRLQHQPQLAGRVWQSPAGPVVLGPYVYGFFGVAGHPMGTPYVVAGFK